jgi:hypothetical protein
MLIKAEALQCLQVVAAGLYQLFIKAVDVRTVMACVYIGTERTADQFTLTAGHAERARGAPGSGRLSDCFGHGAYAIDAFTAVADHVIDPPGKFVYP